MIDKDEELDIKEQNDKRRIIIISLISVVIVMLLTLSLIAFALNKKSSSNRPTEVTENNTENISSEIINTTITEPNETISDNTTEYEEQTTETEEPTEAVTETEIEETVITEPVVEKEHGFIINNMGYTYLYDGKGYLQFNGTTNTAKRYASVLNSLRSMLDEKIKIYSIVAPTAVEFAEIPRDIIVEDDFYNSSQKKNIDLINENLSGITGINLVNDFNSRTGEYLYFNTDKNWTSIAAYHAYEQFAAAAGCTPIPLETYEKTVLEGYLGSFYKATENSYLLNNADTVELYLIDKTYPVEMVLYSGGKTYNNRQLVTTQISSIEDYGYYAFLGGPGQRFEIKTPAKNAKKILIIGDSSAFPFVPYLAGNYSEIYFLDAEAISSKSKVEKPVTEYVSEKGIDEILFLSYATNTQTQSYCDQISNLYN